MINKTTLILVLLLAFAMQMQGQIDNPISGEVTFVTTSNIYVKFESTDFIDLGDTLLLNENEACLIVSNKSSYSVVCSRISDCQINKGDMLFFQPRLKSTPEFLQEELKTDSIPFIPAIEIENPNQERIKGRISFSSYNNIASERNNNYRLMSRFSLNASHINNSKFSFETYMNYRYKFPDSESNVNQQVSFFRIYNLAIRFDADPTLSFTLGRKINSKAWSLGAIDGLQVEKFFGKTYLGAIVGFRPDIFDYSFNPNLFEYGVYLGRLTRSDNFYSETTLGYIEQKNQNQIDRRYTFFQFSSTVYRKLNLFSSVELDLYSKVNGEASSNPRLTNLYASARYRFSRKFDVFVSYDSRKRIIYYETFQSEVDRILDDDLARQGIRIRANVRPIKYLSIGGSYSKRFEADQQNKSDNIYAYVSLSRVPGIGGGRIIASFNNNKSNYLQSRVFALRYSIPLIKRKLNAEFYYRHVNYIYTNAVESLNQNYFGGSFSYNITRRLLFSISGEMSTFNQENNYRIYAKVVQRIYGKKKKQ